MTTFFEKACKKYLGDPMHVPGYPFQRGYVGTDLRDKDLAEKRVLAGELDLLLF